MTMPAFAWRSSRQATPASPIAARRHCRPPGRTGRAVSARGPARPARWAAAMRPRGESAHARGGARRDDFHVRCALLSGFSEVDGAAGEVDGAAGEVDGPAWRL